MTNALIEIDLLDLNLDHDLDLSPHQVSFELGHKSLISENLKKHKFKIMIKIEIKIMISFG